MHSDSLRAFNLKHIGTVTTPMNPGTDYTSTDSGKLVGVHRVHETLGMLL